MSEFSVVPIKDGIFYEHIKTDNNKKPFYFYSMTNYLMGSDNPELCVFISKINVYSVILKTPSPSGYKRADRMRAVLP